MLAGFWLADLIGRQILAAQGLTGSSPVSGVPVAIVLGLLLRNTLPLPASLNPGLKFATTTILRAGIVLVGIRLSLIDVVKLGIAGLPVVLAAIGTGLVFVTWFNRKLGLPPRLGTLIATVESAFGPGAKVTDADVQPFLGEAGQMPPWALTDAIDSGDIATAVDRLHRMVGAGGMHPLQVLAVITTHFRRILALEGADVRTEADAASRLGIKGSTFPAKKALGRANRLGYEGASRAVSLLAQADVDLRGRTAWPDDLVLEVLVARLARMSR